jgi:hypothetical protein
MQSISPSSTAEEINTIKPQNPYEMEDERPNPVI